MRILYDHQIFTRQRYGGVSRYFYELMDQFSRTPDINFSLAIRYSYNENLCNRHVLDQYWSKRSPLFCNKHIFPAIHRITNIDVLQRMRINQKESVRLLNKQDFDTFHPTYYDPFFLQYIQKKPFVLTVYDMIHELYPDYFPSDNPTKIWKRVLIEKAGAIIAISDNTKKDILKFTQVDPDRISVVYLGNPFEYIQHQDQSTIPLDNTLLEKSYILFVGTRSGYKNFGFFIQSVVPLLQKYTNLQVYCAGGGPFTLHDLKNFNELNIISQVKYFEINDIRMRDLYKNARAFIFPSLYEGFGLPILEAFSCGCPVILCNSSSLAEIGADAACYFDPYDPELLVQRIENLLTDNHFRDKLIKKGFERLNLFSWEKIAQDTKKVYDKISYQ